MMQRNEKNISTWYENEKESTNQRGHFLDFYIFSGSYMGPKSSLHRRTEISSFNWCHESRNCLYAATFSNALYCFLFIKKTLIFTEVLLNFNGTYMDRKKQFESFWKWMLWVVSFSGVDAFLPIWKLFALGFYCDILSSGYRNRKS